MLKATVHALKGAHGREAGTADLRYGYPNPAAMGTDAVPDELARLVRKMHAEYTDSEVEIAMALASTDGPLSIDELAAETGYTERTIKKRVGTLEETLGGSPLIERDEDDRPYLHASFAAALRTVEPEH